MAYYLNSTTPATLYGATVKSPYFVDKSLMIAELLEAVGTQDKNICITRPRRFGKSTAANMAGAFFTKGTDSSRLFDPLRISGHPLYRRYLNQYNVIFIDLLKPANLSGSYIEFIRRIEKPLSKDLRKAYPDMDFPDSASPADNLAMIYEKTGERFILVIDEWDSVFRKNYISDDDRDRFIRCLSALTKDADYLALTYMTGVLPVARCTAGPDMDHFTESNVADAGNFGAFFGFTASEVDGLYGRYTKLVEQPVVTRESLEDRCDGYRFGKEEHLYNPRSVVMSLTNNRTGSYWAQTGAFSDLAAYIENGADGVKSAIAGMAAGEPVPVPAGKHAAGSGQPDKRDRILSDMVVYGLLTYDGTTGTVRIPNKELLKEFTDAIREEPGMGCVNRLAVASDAILRATLREDGAAVAEALTAVHRETPIRAYDRGKGLSVVLYFAYLSAMESYEIRREGQPGKCADIIFLPGDGGKTGMIIELGIDMTPEEALRRIGDKKYIRAFGGGPGEGDLAAGRVLAAGITYDSKSGEHQCRIEELTVG